MFPERENGNSGRTAHSRPNQNGGVESVLEREPDTEWASVRASTTGTVTVKRMHCEHREATVEDAPTGAGGVWDPRGDREVRTATVGGDACSVGNVPFVVGPGLLRRHEPPG